MLQKKPPQLSPFFPSLSSSRLSQLVNQREQPFEDETDVELLINLAVTAVKSLSPVRGHAEFCRRVAAILVKEDEEDEEEESNVQQGEAPTGGGDMEVDPPRVVESPPVKSIALSRNDVSFDMLPPDVVVSGILTYLTLVVYHYDADYAHDMGIAARIVHDQDDPCPRDRWRGRMALDDARSAVEVTKYERWASDNPPNVECLFGYFSRDGLRYPWFVFRNVFFATSWKPGSFVLAGRDVLVDRSKIRRLEFALDALPEDVPSDCPNLLHLGLCCVDRDRSPLGDHVLNEWLQSPLLAGVDSVSLGIDPVEGWNWRGEKLAVFRASLENFVSDGHDLSHVQNLSLVVFQEDDFANLEDRRFPQLVSLKLDVRSAPQIDLNQFFVKQNFVNLEELEIFYHSSLGNAGFELGFVGCDFGRLRKLKISRCKISDVLFQVHTFPSLEHFELHFFDEEDSASCRGSEWRLDPSQLKVLRLSSVNSSLLVNFLLSRGRNLEQLHLTSCNSAGWKGWNLPNLRSLKVDQIKVFGGIFQVTPVELVELSYDCIGTEVSGVDVRAFFGALRCSGLQKLMFRELGSLSVAQEIDPPDFSNKSLSELRSIVIECPYPEFCHDVLANSHLSHLKVIDISHEGSEGLPAPAELIRDWESGIMRELRCLLVSLLEVIGRTDDSQVCCGSPSSSVGIDFNGKSKIALQNWDVGCEINFDEEKIVIQEEIGNRDSDRLQGIFQKLRWIAGVKSDWKLVG